MMVLDGLWLFAPFIWCSFDPLFVAGWLELHNKLVLSSSFSQILGLAFSYSLVHCSSRE
jgi:hypothetical protein